MVKILLIDKPMSCFNVFINNVMYLLITEGNKETAYEWEWEDLLWLLKTIIYKLITQGGKNTRDNWAWYALPYLLTTQCTHSSYISKYHRWLRMKGLVVLIIF